MAPPPVCEDAGAFFAAMRNFQATSLHKYRASYSRAAAVNPSTVNVQTVTAAPTSPQLPTPSQTESHTAQEPSDRAASIIPGSGTTAVTMHPVEAETRQAAEPQKSDNDHAEMASSAAEPTETQRNGDPDSKAETENLYDATPENEAASISQDAENPDSKDLPEAENQEPSVAALPTSPSTDNYRRRGTPFTPTTAQESGGDYFITTRSNSPAGDDDSDGSDEVLFRQNERNQIAGRPKPPPLRLERPSETAAKERDSDHQVPTDKADPGSSPAKSTNPENKPSNDSKTTDAAQTYGCLVQQPGRNKRVVRQKTPEEVQAQLDELRRLQQEQIINLGYKRRGIEPNEDPFKSLKLARQGPGAERDSPFSLELARLTGPEGKSQKIPYYAEANHSAVDGEPVLLRERTDAVVLSPGYDSSEYGDAAEPGKSGTVLVDWMYRDWTKGKDPSCVEKFRNWLDAMSKPTIAVDMSQQAFLDGSLHSDGVSGMIGMELPDVDTYPDTSPASREHRHETAAGYNHNWIQRLRKEEEESRKKARRTTTHTVAAVVKEPEPVRNPNAPKANIYLRPVEPKDIPQLVAIFNWHVKNSTCVLELENITEDEMRGHIEECEQEDLPFIVAAELLPGIRYAENGHKELIYGYILAVDFTGANTINRFTAELELLVNPATRKQGVGKCLVDKVLDILDPRYSRKGGYHFDYPANKRQVYGSCRGRQMAKVLFAVPYPSDKDSEYVWLKSWLVDKFRFEEQGILRGIGVKGNQVLDMGYLVYSTGVDPLTGNASKAPKPDIKP